MTDRIKILVSACLLGEKMRYDGGHKNETLDPFVSPSSGMERVKAYGGGGIPARTVVHD